MSGSGRSAESGVASASSTTHEHLLAVVATEALSAGYDRVSVLDAGCGNGKLMAYLQANMRPATRAVEADLFGFDVHDEDIQIPGFLEGARELLSTEFPDRDWSDRIRHCSKDDPWPFDGETFDFVVSNQVGEHLASLERFFQENARVLRQGGVAVHLFPLRSYVIEGHLLLPFIHRIGSHDLRRDAIAAFSRLGFGKYHPDRGELSTWAEAHADYVHHLTHYRNWPDVTEAAKQAGLRASYRYTPDFYWRRLARLAGREYPFVLRTAHRSVRDAMWFRILRLVSSVTVVLEKRQTYSTRGSGEHQSS